MNRDVFRRWQINIDVDDNAEKEYCFSKGGKTFNSGDVCVGNPALYCIDSGRLNCDTKGEFIFLYKQGDYYFVRRNHPIDNGEYVFVDVLGCLIDHKEKPKRELDNWEQVKLGLYILLMLFGVIVKARIVWWIFITAMFFTFNRKKEDNNNERCN